MGSQQEETAVSWGSPVPPSLPRLTSAHSGATQGQDTHTEQGKGCCLGEEQALKSRPLISKENNGIFWDSH